jgi:large subunit ribosomal protein L32e
MADDPPAPVTDDGAAPAAPAAPPAAPPKTARRVRASKPAAAAKEPAPAPAKEGTKETEAPKAPRRARLSPELAVLLATRRRLDRTRPAFVRQAAHRYERIGRDESWRRPRGLQSKQRRHYGYRSKVVRIGYRSPARVRGLTPAGFRPVLVRTRGELDGLDALKDAAVIARTVGTRRRLVLEEEARRLGIRVLNPIEKAGEES